jgi:hypothetical protein
MSKTANKFLGLDSINVLIDYIDKTIKELINKYTNATITAYKYVAKDNDTNESITPDTPSNGGINYNTANIIYPDGWNSLQMVLESLNNNEPITKDTENVITAKLEEGDIYMSVGVQSFGKITWSYPIKMK